jgi:hypothetical protein
MGFSLGGNVLLNYLSNSSEVPLQVLAAAAISVPIDLRGSAMELDNGINRIYMQRFLNSMLKKMLLKNKLFPKEVDIKSIHKIKNFKDFDDAYTAPLNGYKDANEYWNKCSSKDILNTINTPTLLINAQNDPFLSASCFNDCLKLSQADIAEYLSTASENYVPPKFQGWLAYSLGSHVAEALVAIKGPDILVEMYSEMSKDISFAAAFKNIFGVDWNYAIPILAKTIFANLNEV